MHRDCYALKFILRIIYLLIALSNLSMHMNASNTFIKM